MTVILQNISNHLGLALGILAALGFTIERTPIPFNPITWILKQAGAVINGEVKKELKEMRKDIKDLSSEVNDNEINRLRYEILDFANSVKHGRKHTKDEWEHIFEANERYHCILCRLNKTNGYIDIEVEFLKKTYQAKSINNDFLK